MPVNYFSNAQIWLSHSLTYEPNTVAWYIRSYLIQIYPCIYVVIPCTSAFRFGHHLPLLPITKTWHTLSRISAYTLTILYCLWRSDPNSLLVDSSAWVFSLWKALFIIDSGIHSIHYIFIITCEHIHHSIYYFELQLYICKFLFSPYNPILWSIC